MAKPATETSELVVLAVLADGPRYGYAISKQIAAQSSGAMKLTPGVLYPLMTRLERDGLVRARWEEVRSDRAEGDAPGRRRKWYELTPRGRRRLDTRIAAHRAYLAIIDSFIGPARPRAEIGGEA